MALRGGSVQFARVFPPQMRSRASAIRTLALGALLLSHAVGCKGVEPLQNADGVLLSAFPAGVPIVLHPGELTKLAVQATDSSGNGANGVGVVFALTNTEEVTFAGAPSGALTEYALTSTSKAFGVSAPGIATVTIAIPVSAPLGTTTLVADFASAPPDGGVTWTGFTVRIDAPAVDAGTAGDGGGDATSDSPADGAGDAPSDSAEVQ